VKATSAVLLAGLLGGGSLATANTLYRAGQVDRAVEEYRKVAANDSSALVRYNMGTALLRAGRYDEARRLLGAAADADSAGGATKELRFRAAYNAGNTDLEPVFRKQVPDSARNDRLRRAIGRYKQALRLSPGDLDAKWNLELAQRLLQQSGGGGGGAQNNQGGGGGSGNQSSSQSPNPSPSGSGGSPISQERAEKILEQAENSETVVQRQKLKKAPTGQRAVRDW
jgi:Ca-activated chloride channel family protein